MDKKTGWSIIKNIFKLVVTLGALYWVSRKIALDELKDALQGANPLFLALAFCSYCFSQLLASSRLNGFFKGIGLQLTERYNFRLYQLGLLYNFFLPGGIGGDGYKIYFLKKNHAIKGRKILSAVFFDRLSGLWALCMVIATLVIFMPRLAIPNSLTVVVVLLATASYYYFLRLLFKNFLARFFSTHLKALAVQGLQTISAICILYAMGFQGKFSPYLLIFMGSSLVSIIPSIGGGVGLRELVMIHGATYFQLDPHIAVLISLIFYIISLLVASSGIYYIFRPQRLGADKLPSVSEIEQEIDKEN